MTGDEFYIPVTAAGDPSVGMLQTTTDDTNIIRDVAEAIDFLSPFDVPFLDLVGKDSLHHPCTQIQHEWWTDQLIGRAGTLLSAYTAGSGTMTLASDQGKYLLPDDLILVGNAVYRVASGPPDSDVLQVVWVGGVADASQDAATSWRKLSQASQQAGLSRTDMKKTEVGNPYNYTQIIKDWIIISGTMNAIKRYGYASERAYQEDKLLKRLAIDLEQSILYGARSYSAGPPIRSTMGGLLEFVLTPGISNSWDTVYNANSAVFTEKMLNDVMQEVFDVGGEPDFIMVNGTNKRYMTSWATPRIRTDREERTAGASIAVYESDFGLLDVVLNRNLRATDVIIGKRGSLGIGPLEGRQFSSRELPVSGDFTHYEILGEYTIEVHKPSVDWGWIYGTASAYT